mmetsp:Transcript_40682/g.128266  ORF Transcript_40682/g.128266 Transcript_40682/m.128266 type:complete len:83 (+) Transcript_40682:1708-1956(+)
MIRFVAGGNGDGNGLGVKSYCVQQEAHSGDAWIIAVTECASGTFSVIILLGAILKIDRQQRDAWLSQETTLDPEAVQERTAK